MRSTQQQAAAAAPPGLSEAALHKLERLQGQLLQQQRLLNTALATPGTAKAVRELRAMQSAVSTALSAVDQIRKAPAGTPYPREPG